MLLRIRTVTLFFLSLLMLARLDASALKWKTEQIDTEVIEGQQDEVKAAFPFTNTGDHPVTITSVRTSCGCTTAGLSKKTYAAGESGEITAVFHTGERTGLQKKFIMVMTDEPNQAGIRLLFQINIKEYLTLTPRLLMWKMGDEPSEQQLVLSALPSRPITEIQPQEGEPGTFETRIETVAKGLKYNVYVKPVSTAKRVSTIITFQAKFVGMPEGKVVAYVYINPPGIKQTDD